MADTPSFLVSDVNATFLTEDVVSETAPRGKITFQNRVDDLVATTGLSEEEVLDRVDSEGFLTGSFEDRVLPEINTKSILDTLIDKEVSLEELEEGVAKKQEVEKALSRVEELSSVDAALAKDPTASGELFKIEHRAGIAKNIFLDKAEEANDGFFSSVWELIDNIAYDTYAGVRDIPTSIRGEGTELTELSQMWANALRSMSDDEFEKFVYERLDAVKNDFIPTGQTSSWRLLREIQAMDAAGVVAGDKELGVLFGALSVVDVATLGGVSGAKLITKAGRSTVGKIKGVAGTRVSTKAAEESTVVRQTGKDTVKSVEESVVTDTTAHVKNSRKEADLLDDMSPSATATTIVPEPKPAPTSAARIAQKVSENYYVQSFLSRQAAKSFGTVDLTVPATEWAKTEATRLARASGTNVIDYNVTTEGIQQAKASIVLGKSDGLPYKSKRSAENKAKKIPNAEVKRVDGTNGPEFVVEVETRVPTRDLVNPSDISGVRNRFWVERIFGRADIGSNSFMSNLADQGGDFGLKGFEVDVRNKLKSVYKTPRKDLRAIDEVLTSLRDTPNGGTGKAWLNHEDFVEAFRELTGELPSKKAIQAYEEIIELSDFSWYIKANERLSVMANQGTTIVNVRNHDLQAFPSKSTHQLQQENPDLLVWDVARDTKVPVSTLKPDAPILELSVPTKEGEQFVTNFYGKTRTPELEDALSYNAGGPRSNPDAAWFVGSQDGTWATLIGARTEKEAAKGASEFNAISKAIRNKVGREVPEEISSSTRRELDEVVRRNNNWNPEIEDLEDFLEFTKLRGVSPTSEVFHRGRGERMGSIIKTNDKTLVDLNLESFTSYNRHDQALVMFGGEKASNPHPLLAIQRQFRQMASRGAITQYRMHHPTAWVKAVERAIAEGKIARQDFPSAPMTDELKVMNYQIKGDSETARKLRQEQSVINRRLDNYNGSTSALPTQKVIEGWDKAVTWFADKVYDLDVVGTNSISKVLRLGTADNISNRALSLGFFQKMTSPDQLLLQASHAIAISAVSPVNGFKAVQLAGFIRQAAREGSEGVWNGVLKGLRRSSFLSEEELQALTKHMLDSGRGYMRGAVAEDPLAGTGNSMLGKVRDLISSPYYAGENFQATVSRITAFLDIRKSHPSLSVDSDAFWNAVIARDRDLAWGLNRAQRSVAQSDPLLRVMTQWSSYPLRGIETVFFNNNLTAAERGRVAAVTTMLWGLGGLGLDSAANYVEEKQLFGVFSNVIARGADVALENLVGIRAGDRIAIRPVELFERAYQTAMFEYSDAVPAYKIVSDTAGPALSALSNFASGRHDLARHDVQTLARAWKVVDSATMAYTMRMEDVRRTKGGSELRKDFTSSQEFFQAIGVAPAEVKKQFEASSMIFSARKRREAAEAKALPYFQLAIKAMQEGDYDKGRRIMNDADAIVRSYNLPPTRLAEVRESLMTKAGFDNVNWLVLEMIKDEYTNKALQLEEDNN